MAGQLTIDTLKASSGVLATQNGMTGIAKAWVNFDGVTTVTIRASFNVSSVTRNSTGDYTISFTTTMPDANYSWSGSASRQGTSSSTGAGYIVTGNDNVTARTASSFRIVVERNAGDGAFDALTDSAYINVNVLGS